MPLGSLLVCAIITNKQSRNKPKHGKQKNDLDLPVFRYNASIWRALNKLELCADYGR